jgi:hypothetical protein
LCTPLHGEGDYNPFAPKVLYPSEIIYYIMRKPRIALEPHALRALKVWSALEDKDPGDLAGEIILAHMPMKVREALGDVAPMPSSPAEQECRKEGEVIVCAPKKPRLTQNPDALRKIEEMLAQSPRPSTMDIAKAVGYPKATVYEAIKRQRVAQAGQG